ncbi:hypothetical protein KZ483_20265 [Paenibacillus sp. sptzw28]|uniref:hypothetical protein n=1 Tax=Paenibacillus sp. sptzw28 TaxID=715179 RepID=UPI001C6E369F|nr:hypothetical protein [Paenibacillus sp. sptzw28]QYR20165.1 hypothetical protein KZ483_20265 [Paenibacillus sp. sptzw28]
MRRQTLKTAVVGGLIAIVVLFGIDMASSGIERIYGPIEQNGTLPVGSLEYNDAADQAAPSGQNQAAADDMNVKSAERQGQAVTEGIVQRIVDAQHGRKAEPGQVASQPKPGENDRLPGIPDIREDSTVNKLADGTAGLLQTVSSKGIRALVSFFESVTD